MPSHYYDPMILRLNGHRDMLQATSQMNKTRPATVARSDQAESAALFVLSNVTNH